MTKLVLKTLGKLANEPLEVYWLVGFSLSVRGEWQVRVVFRGLQSGTFHLHPLPIGLLPILPLGVWFEHGEYRWDQVPGEMGKAVITDLGRPQILTSADIPPALYRFPSRGGVQRLFSYQTPQGEILIPVVELMRHLFIPNRKLAQAVMRKDGLNLFYHPQEPGFQETCELRFTQEMPHQLLSKEFAKAFGWIALDPGARKSWDSIRILTEGRDHVMFAPPPIENACCHFRGIRLGKQWLVLEVCSLSGRQAPFNQLHLTHPRFRRTRKVRMDASDRDLSKHTGRGSKTPRVEKVYEYEIEASPSGSTAESNLKVMEAPIPRSGINGCDRVIKESAVTYESETGSNPSGGHPAVPQNTRKQERVSVSAEERDDSARFPPIEFRGLRPALPETMGDLEALDKTVRQMRCELPNQRFSQALVALKSGRAFSVIGDRPRPAMVVMIRSTVQMHPPIVLLDVERTGVAALSLMALRFRTPSVALDLMERAIQAMLNGLVDSGGSWSRKSEEKLSGLCECNRLPKALTPRDKIQRQARIWALRVIDRLELKS